MRRCAASILFAALLTCPAAAQQSAGESQALSEGQVPRAVAVQLRCSQPQGPVTRRAFFGGFVFEQPCQLRGETQSRLVFATDAEGKDARLLQFHRPEGRRLSALANVRFDSAKNEIAGTTGRLSRRICRTEGRWRLEGKRPAPALVFFRQTRDCDGNRGWQVMVNRDAR